jgi:hypothetical protein
MMCRLRSRLVKTRVASIADAGLFGPRQMLSILLPYLVAKTYISAAAREEFSMLDDCS